LCFRSVCRRSLLGDYGSRDAPCNLALADQPRQILDAAATPTGLTADRCISESTAPTISAAAMPVQATTGRQFREAWTKDYPWIEYDAANDKVFCTVCKKCETLQLFNFSTKREPAFTSAGFTNWKHATETYKSLLLTRRH
jgi:hypothetical protein